MTTISSLRIFGLVFGAIMLFIGFKKLRVHDARKINAQALLIVGAILIAICIFPGMLNIPTQLLKLNHNPNGRLVTILIFATIIIFYMTILNLSKHAQLKKQLDKFIEWEICKNEQKIAEGEAILLLIPAYNESDNLKELLPKIKETSLAQHLEVLVINDGSTDNTAHIAKSLGATVVTHPFNRGQGAGLRTGWEYAKQRGFDIIVTMDADGQHNPEEIPKLIQPILKNKADFVIGSRLLGSHDHYSSLRTKGVSVFNFLINKLMKTKITDCASGFRSISMTSQMRNVKLKQDQYISIELIIDAIKQKAKIEEVPIHIHSRTHGDSKKGSNLFYSFGFFKTLITSWWTL